MTKVLKNIEFAFCAFRIDFHYHGGPFEATSIMNRRYMIDDSCTALCRFFSIFTNIFYIVEREKCQYLDRRFFYFWELANCSSRFVIFSSSSLSAYACTHVPNTQPSLNKQWRMCRGCDSNTKVEWLSSAMGEHSRKRRLIVSKQLLNEMENRLIFLFQRGKICIWIPYVWFLRIVYY